MTIVDQRNHHLFQPLLYQVATASLATSENAWPVRHLFRIRPKVTTLLAAVSGVAAEAKRVVLDDGSALSYDTLVLATAARHAYFGHDEWEPFASPWRSRGSGPMPSAVRGSSRRDRRQRPDAAFRQSTVTADSGRYSIRQLSPTAVKAPAPSSGRPDPCRNYGGIPRRPV
jgi:hypothetical protein